MASFELTTQGIEAGYSEDGFFAFGTSTLHKLDNGEDWEWTIPRIGEMPIHWRIALTSKDVFNDYKALLWKTENRTARLPLLEDYFVRIEAQPVGKLHRWDNEEPISLVYYLPNDPSLAALIMGVIAAGRDLTIYGQGFLWAKQDVAAPATSVPGFMERNEPAFTLEAPTLRIK